MTATDLVLKGTVTINGTDVSTEITGVIIKTTVVDVKVPATLGSATSHAPGAAKYEVQFDYLSTDGDTGALFAILWAAIATDAKELPFTALLRNGVVGVANPQWSGTFVVPGVDLGGEVETLSQGSISCVLTGKPTRATS